MELLFWVWSHDRESPFLEKKKNKWVKKKDNRGGREKKEEEVVDIKLTEIPLRL